MIKLWGFFKGILIQDSTDRTKQISVEIDSSATTATRTTLKSAQTANRTIDLPDATDTLVGKATTDTLTNKSMDGDDNTFSDIDLPSLKVQLADAAKFLLRDGSGNVVSGNAVPDGTVVGDTDTQTLTNKTLDGTDATGTNTISADASDITYDNSTSGLTATTSQAAVDEVEGRLDTVESDKLDAPATHADNLLIKTDGVDTHNSQTTGISIDDSNNVTGVNDLTINGNLQVDGTTTTLNTANLDVTDKNITVNDTGNDASAEGAGLTVERTGTDGSLVYEDALTSKFKIGALASEVEIADVSSSQTITNKDMSSATNNIDTASADSLTRNTGNQQVVTIPDTATPDTIVLEAHAQVITNKDFDGGTASNTSRMTIPKSDTTTLAGLTRKEATIAYDTDLDTIVYDDGVSFNPLTSEGQGGINYISNPDFETDSVGWNTYDDASGAVPINGTGGVGLTVNRNLTNVLRGVAQGVVSKGAVSTQGKGFSTDIIIDRADENRPLNVSFDYSLTAISSPSDFKTGDLKLFVYDVDNAILLGTVCNGDDGDIITTQNTSGKFSGTFSATDSSNYRLIFHSATTNSDDWDFTFDNVRVGPVGFIPVTTITEWQTYTPTYTGFGTVSFSEFVWRRVGDSLEVKGLFTSGVSTAVEARISLPLGLTSAGVGKIPSVIITGSGAFNVSGAFIPIPLIETSVTYMTVGLQEASSAGIAKLNGNQVMSVGAGMGFFATVPIEGWSTGNIINNTELSQQTPKADMYLIANQSVLTIAKTDIAFDASNFDTHNMFDSGNNSLVIPTSMYYQIDCGLNLASVIVDERVTVSIEVNGVAVISRLVRAGVTDTPQDMSRILFLNKDDVITVTSDSTADANYLIRGSSSLSYLSIAGLPDFTTYGVVGEKNKIQTKFLSVDVVSDLTISDLTFNNLIIGKQYEVRGNVILSLDVGSPNTGIQMNIRHNAATLESIFFVLLESSDSGQDTITKGISMVFTATATTLTFVSSSASASSLIAGNGSRSETYVQLEERNDLIETTSFT